MSSLDSESLQAALFQWLGQDSLVDEVNLEESEIVVRTRDKSRRVTVRITAKDLGSCFDNLSAQSRQFWPDRSATESAWCLLVENVDEALSTYGWRATAMQLASDGKFEVLSENG